MKRSHEAIFSINQAGDVVVIRFEVRKAAPACVNC
jgi:hypothetical protein